LQQVFQLCKGHGREEKNKNFPRCLHHSPGEFAGGVSGNPSTPNRGKNLLLMDFYYKNKYGKKREEQNETT